MNKMQEQVQEFHKVFGLTINNKPDYGRVTLIDKNLRYDLIKEELEELSDAMYTPNGIVEVADAIGDLLYVVLGTAVTFGIDMDPIFDEIHRSNMTKVPVAGIIL